MRIRVVEQPWYKFRGQFVRSIRCNCDSYCGSIDRWKEAIFEREREFRASVKFILHSFVLYASAILFIMRFISIARNFVRDNVTM